MGISQPGKVRVKKEAFNAADAITVAAVTSAASASSPTKTEFDKTVVDIAALRAELLAVVNILKAAND